MLTKYTCFLSTNWNEIGHPISKYSYLTLPLRLSPCDFADFNVADAGCGKTDGLPRTDWAKGRVCDDKFALDTVLSFIVTVELFDGLGLYKQFGSISFPTK